MTTDPLKVWLLEQTERTRRTYGHDLRVFANFRGVGLEGAVREFLGMTKGEAFGVALAWKRDLERGGLAPATVARRLSSLRSLTSTANALGMCEWKLGDLKCHTTPREDRRGPSWEEGVQLLEAVRPGGSHHTQEAHLWVQLMLVEALRVSEVVCLRSADLVREGLWVRQKGLRGERALKAISDETHQLLTAYIARAGKLDTTWLFEGSNFRDHVSSRTLQRAIARLGEEVLGRRVRCHGLRHTSITKAVESGGIANAMLHARHKYPKTTMRYFDTKSISQLQTATTLSDAASPSRHIEPPTETPHVPLVGRGPTDHRGSE